MKLLYMLTLLCIFFFYSISEVILGAHSIKKEEKDSKQFREVKKQFPHPDFCNILKGNDLMLLKVRSIFTVQFTILNEAKMQPCNLNAFSRKPT